MIRIIAALAGAALLPLAAPAHAQVGGVPLEQQFVARNLDRLTGVGVIKTSGGLFDFLSGSVIRAPRLVRMAGLEWLFRLLQEPRRLFRRYVYGIPRFFYAIVRLRFFGS